MKKHNMTMSDLYCTVCNEHRTVPRLKAKQREKGHIKTMWCCHCGCERDFKEVREKDFIISNVG